MKQKISLFLLYYLRFFAKLQIQKYKKINSNFKVIGITGSAGKSSAVLACQSVLEPNFKVKTNNGYNSESGVPLGILGIKLPNYSISSWLKIFYLAPLNYLKNKNPIDYLILEMGIDGPSWPKNMDFLLSIVKPDIGIFLNVTSVHMQFFDSIDQIAKEKAKLVNTSSVAIINSEDKLVKQYTKNKNQINIQKENIKIPKYLLPDIYQITLGSAITLSNYLKIDKKTAISNLKNNFTLPPSRSSVFKGKFKSTIIDSSYNSSPLACIEMLNFLNSFKNKKIAILGDMRELGQSSQKDHQDIYKHALKTSDLIISVGPQTKEFFGENVLKFDYFWQVNSYIKNNIQHFKNSTILIKGSQNTIFTEEIVKFLIENKKDIKNICRQTLYWQNLKKEFKNKNS